MTSLPVQSVAPTAEPVWIRRGAPEYRRVGLALFLVGLASFSLIYCVQPLLPEFSTSYGVTPSESALALSLTTGFLAFSILGAGVVANFFDRRWLIFSSMTLAAILNVVAALSPGWEVLLAARAVEGFVLGGVPAIAMAYLAEEIDPADLGKTMGLYVAGTGLGAMIGRVGMGLFPDASWRMTLLGVSAVCLIAAIGFFRMLPKSRNFQRRTTLVGGFELGAWKAVLTNRDLAAVYLLGFLLTSIFTTLFNYSVFRMVGAPFHFSQTGVSMLFLVFSFGIASSSVAGVLIDRFGRKPLLAAGFAIMLAGLLLTLSGSVPVIVVGIAIVSAGFFVGHAAASSSTGPLAGRHKPQAAALYLFFYYMGASLTGFASGWLWQSWGWIAVAVLTSALALAGVTLALASGRRRAG